MLRSLHLTNYRAFADEHVELGSLTAFVGANASGKSSLLRACTGGHFVAADVRARLGKGRIKRIVDGQDTGGLFEAPYALTMIGLGPVLRLEPDQISAARPLQEERSLAGTGANLVNVLGTMPRRQRELLARRFAELVPVFADVDIRPASTGTHRIVFQDRWAENVWYEPTQVSDGSLLTLALLTLAFQPTSHALVAIEEPDHGLHPHLLSNVVDLLRELSTREPSPIQIVIATQSSELLNLLRPEEVRFLTRREDGSVAIEAANTDTVQWREAWEAHQESLANLWLSGTAGGVP